VASCASGEVAFPRLIEKLEKAGCDQATVGFVLPAGYSFNLDGSGIQMALSAVFIAQATDTPFPLSQQLALFAVMLFTSKGGTTVAGGAFIKLAATLQATRALPLSGLGLLFGIDRFMATGSSVTNVIGNAVAVLAIARWDDAFDRAKFDEYLAARKREADAETTRTVANRTLRSCSGVPYRVIARIARRRCIVQASSIDANRPSRKSHRFNPIRTAA